MPVTLYQLAKRLKLSDNPPRLSHIGNLIYQKYRDQYGINPPKVEQVENGKTFTVNNYPDSFTDLITEALKGWKETPKREKIVEPAPNFKPFKENGLTGLKSETTTFIGMPQFNEPKKKEVSTKRAGKRPRTNKPFIK